MENRMVIIHRELWELVVEPEWKIETPVKRGMVGTDQFYTDHLPRIGEILSLHCPEPEPALPSKVLRAKVVDVETRMGFSRKKRNDFSRLEANSLVVITLEAYMAPEGCVEIARQHLGRVGLKNWETV
jgi:hypothetical protein